MNKKPENGTIEKIEAIFFELNGFNFGVDIEQISEIVELNEAEENNYVLIKLDEGLPSAARFPTPKTPMVLKIEGVEATGLVVHRVEGIRSIDLDHIRPFPSFLEKYDNLIPFLGVILGENHELGFFIDCYRVFDVLGDQTKKANTAVVIASEMKN